MGRIALSPRIMANKMHLDLALWGERPPPVQMPVGYTEQNT